MRLLVDAKEYSNDLRIFGYLLSAIMILFLGAVSFFAILATLLSLYAGEVSSTDICIFGVFGPMAVLVLFLMGVHSFGMLTFSPMKVYDEGVELQDGLKRRLIRFDEIRSIEIYHIYESLFPDNGCSIETRSGARFSSQERFANKSSLEKMMEKLQPLLEGMGFRLEGKEEGRRSAGFRFTR